MAMQINENYAPSQTTYAEQAKEKQAAEKAVRAKKADSEKEAGTSGASQPQDEYIRGEKSGTKPTGLYRMGKDENGNRKIFYDDPEKAANPDAPAEKCTGNNDRVESEIRNLKEKKQQLEQQLLSAAGDETKVRSLKQKLAQVEQELSRKDNDTYKRQNTTFS